MEGFQDVKYFVKSLYAAIKKKIPTKVSQLTNDAGYKTTDTNTTYKLSKSGSTVTLTGSDGSTSSVTDSNTTYSSLKNPYSLDIQSNGVTVVSYDGSTAKTVNVTNATASSSGLMSASDKSKLDGIASSPSMLTNLGSTAAANVFQASPRPGVTGVLPIANGGTGASSLEGLRSNLDIETTLDTTCNILVDNWVQDKTSLLYSNAVSVAGVKEGYVYDIDAYKGNLTTSAEVEAYNNDFSCISGGYAESEEGKITFIVVDKPAANITVRVKGTQVITTEETQSDEINNQKSTITDLQSKFASLNADLAKQTDEISTINNDVSSKVNSSEGTAKCLTVYQSDLKSGFPMVTSESKASSIYDLINECRYLSGGSCGSVYLHNDTSIPTSWYNFLYIPHRNGGYYGNVNEDNSNYGTLLLFPMTTESATIYKVQLIDNTIRAVVSK